MENVKNKPLAEGNAKSLDCMRTDNTCPTLHDAARLMPSFSTASHSSRHCEGYTMESPSRKRLRDSKKITERKEVEITRPTTLGRTNPPGGKTLYRSSIIRFGNSIGENGPNDTDAKPSGLTENTEATKWAARLCEAARHDTNGMKVYDVMNEMSVSPTTGVPIFQLNVTEGVDAYGLGFEDGSYLLVHTHQLDRRANPTRLVGLAICDECPHDLQELLEATTYESGYSEWNSLRTDIHIPQAVDAWRSAVASPVVNPAGGGSFQPQAKTNAPAKVGRNEPCPCRSGKKFK